MIENRSRRIIRAFIALSASLLEAADEESALRAFMRAGCEALDASGCLFTPFNEFSQGLAPLTFGRVPHMDAAPLNDLSLLRKCRACKARHAEGSDCPLSRGDSEAKFVHCVPLRAREKETGLFSFVFLSKPAVELAAKRFLSESARLTGIALERPARERLFRSSQYAGVPSELPEEIKSFLAHAEARAILEERARLAREIHDGLAQTLAFLKIEIGRAEAMLAHDKPAQAARLLKDSSRTLGEAYLDAREAIENLRRVPDDRLDGWLKQVAEDFESISGLPVDVDIQIEREFPVHVQAQMIRIVQEALTNVRKHAQASRVRLAARQLETDLLLEVTDDGRGFDPANSIDAARFGLRGMRERAESVGAEFQISSRPQEEGTTIQLRVPLRVGVNL